MDKQTDLNYFQKITHYTDIKNFENILKNGLDITRMQDNNSTLQIELNETKYFNESIIQKDKFKKVVDVKTNQILYEASFDYICVLDFECTCCDQNPQKINSQEIIEFPVVIIDVIKKQIVGQFHTYVKPTIDLVLTEFCKNLTGISQEQVDSGISIQDAICQLHQYLKEQGVLQKEFTFLTCGDFDGNQLKRESKHKQFHLNVPQYLKRWINIKKVFPTHLIYDDVKKPQYNFGNTNQIKKCKPQISGMVEMLDELELKLEGRHHSGLDDSNNIARCVLNLLDRGFQFTQGMVLDNNY